MIKRIKKININSYQFKIIWDNKLNGGWFDYNDLTITIGTKNKTESEIFMILCHELMEICTIEMHIRFNRPDCWDDKIFVFDHRQYETMMNIFTGLLYKFIKK